jgi:hypothetical protein
MGGITGAIQNQMQQSPQYDPYTASRRPNYMPYGPNQQFYQPIYQPSYSQFSPMGYGQAPFGGFYQPPMMGFGQRFGNQMLQQPQRQNMFGPATDISDQGQAALRQMPQQQDMFRPAADIFGPAGERTSVLSERGFSGPMLSPQPMQQQYAPAQMQQTQPRSSGDAFADLAVPMLRRSSFGSRRPAPSNFQYSVNYDSPMLSPQPMQSQYRPIPFASQTTIDQVVSKARADGAADAAAAQAAAQYSGGAKAGGKVHEEGIDSLLKK